MKEPMPQALEVLTDTQAKLEASRCLMCDEPPCVTACPAGVPVKHFIRAIRFGSPRRAINLIRDRNIFAGVCGLACPVDELCVGACRATDLNTPIAIGQLQHYAAATDLRDPKPGQRGPGDGEKVAVIGSGPAGLAAAAELACLGHKPTILEKNKTPGGVCSYGVPKDRLPQELIDGEVAYVKSLGVDIQTSTALDKSNDLDALFADGFKAVYLGIGAQRAATPGIPGEDLNGVTTWKPLLDAHSSFELGEGDEPTVPNSVLVIGGGSVAMDVVHAASNLGAEDIDVVCLESPREMPAASAELAEAGHLGARFHTRSMPLEIAGDNGRATGLTSARIRWAEPDKFVPSNARKIDGTEYWMPAEMIVIAIGARPDGSLAGLLPGVKMDRGGRIVADPETGATSRPGVFAGGDVAVGGGMTIVKAVAEGKQAAQAIDAYLRAK